MNRFKITKIGLLNFWLYDEEEYDFYGGKLILRGTNGSGKSVTMQSFIPLILDGNKSPDRLDPFGSKERKIEDYIIGDSESVQKEEATSYLYMETYNEEENQYITIGLGFRGRKGKPVESWGFSLKDGKRVGKDFFLYKDPANKIPLSKNELKSRLGSINEFTDTTKDYKAMVNRLLFGFPNLDTYDEFIKLLLQLRSNKLSKDYKPTNLVNVLNTVLQPLTEEDLRPLSEAIEQMNKTKEQVETLEKNSKSLKDFLKVYKNYNEIILLTKARAYQKANNDYKSLKNDLDNHTKELEETKENLTQKETRYSKVLEEIEVNAETKKQLDNQDLKQKIESLASINENITSLEEKIKELETKLDTNEQDKLELNQKISTIENEIYNLKREIETTSIDLKSLSEDSYFDEIVFFVDELMENVENEISFDSIFMSLNRYREKVTKMMSILEEEQKILLESESTRVEFEKLSSTYQQLELDIASQEKNLKESIMSWEEDFINKVNNNTYLKLDDEVKKSIFDFMNDYSNKNYEAAKKLYLDYARSLEDKIIKENLKLENKKSLSQKEKSSLELEYQELEQQKDIEIPAKNLETDKILKENNIENISLYKCIEFKNGISDKIKDNIESALLDLNILNAKIIKEKDIPKVSKLNKNILYLTKTAEKKENLLQYFNVTLDENTKMDKKYIEEILKSISTNPKDLLSIGENGISKIDVLNSIADDTYKQTYIGYLKRMELKKHKLQELSEKIEVLSNEIKTIENLINNNEQKISILHSESENFPDNSRINGILDKIKELNLSLTWNDKRQKELEEVLAVIDQKLKSLKEKIAENKQGLYIPLNLESYKTVSLTITSIKEILQNLKTTHNTYQNKLDINNSFKERLEDILNNTSYLEADKNEKERDLKINIQNRDTINQLLETKEYKDQKEKLLEIENNLTSLFKEKDRLIGEVATLKNDYTYKEISLNNLSTNLISLEKELRIYQEIFLREYKLHYVYQEEITELDQTIKKIIQDGKTRKEISLNDALNNFYSSYNHYSLELNDYSLRNITLFADYDTTDEALKRIYSENTRVDVTSMYQGIKLNIIDLSQKLEADILENKDLISKQDRHLFEDILLNTVGEKIRNRIASSNEWVSKINSIMATMQENSALSFKLVWKSISADQEGEIDTKELVRILKMDPKLLKDSDAEKLTNHFRSKIKKAEELYQDSYISFYKIIEEVLDYRSWFTFQLLYQRKGMNLKELTDKTFSKFSGGERAKSMYIPLFASVYAKFNLARENSLRIIALDEAFAGVDEENIREMFGILKYLDIDFIINSQVLWGDYDTIEDLSICELIRPQNSSVVTVERYRWNGKYKEIINNRIEYNKELEKDARV